MNLRYVIAALSLASFAYAEDGPKPIPPQRMGPAQLARHKQGELDSATLEKDYENTRAITPILKAMEDILKNTEANPESYCKPAAGETFSPKTKVKQYLEEIRNIIGSPNVSSRTQDVLNEKLYGFDRAIRCFEQGCKLRGTFAKFWVNVSGSGSEEYAMADVADCRSILDTAILNLNSENYRPMALLSEREQAQSNKGKTSHDPTQRKKPIESKGSAR